VTHQSVPTSVGTDTDVDNEHYLIGSRGFKPGDDRSRLEAYQRKWRNPLDVLALMTVWLVVVPPGVITSNHGLYVVLLIARIGLSAVYAVDLSIRASLAPHHWYYVVDNPLSVATILLPFLRVLFSIQLLRTVFQRGNLDKFALAAGLLFLNLTVVVYFFERRAPHGNIKTLGNAIWWAVVTLTTVGYGDFYPVTPQGRVAAALLMFVGFAVLATVTAQISSAFIDQAARARSTRSRTVPSTSGSDEVTLQSIGERLTVIETELQRQNRSGSSSQAGGAT
jgi:voltage-gated potassium channel